MSGVSPFIRFSRYAALLAGIAYGSSQYQKFQARQDALHAIEAEEKAKHGSPVSASSTASAGVVTDPNAKNFDLAAYLKYLDETSKSKHAHH